jgi:tRNA(adenine34) deaminase
MCACAIIKARIPALVFGARDPAMGSCGSVIDLFRERYGHSPAVWSGVRGGECSELLRAFFGKLRR